MSRINSPVRSPISPRKKDDAAAVPLLRKGTGSAEQLSAENADNGLVANSIYGSCKDQYLRQTPSLGIGKNIITETVEEPPTQWRGLLICGLIMYLTTSMGQTLAVSGWPYLRTIDPEVSVTFLGYVQGLTRFGHAVGCCVFAIHAYTNKTFKKALIIGRIISVIGCAFYIFIELFAPTTRRWAYMLKFLLQSVAEGSLIVVRSYVPRMSQEVDRPRAFSIIEGANMLAIVSGPLVQLACNYALPAEGTPLLGGWLKFNIYTLPIWISLALNCATLYISIFHFKEPELNELDNDSQLPLAQALSKAWEQIKNLDTCLVTMCFIEKSIVSYAFAVMYFTMSPYVTETFNVGEEGALHILSVGQSAAGCISLATVALFAVTPLATIAKARLLFPFSLACYFFMYLMSYPWPGISEDIPLRNNVTAPHGCDASRYGWCGDGLKITHHILWITVCAILLGIGIPVSLIAFDTIYSKVLGSIDQNIMQALLIIMDDLALAGAPMVSTWSFEEFGPGPMWLSVAGICLVGLGLWITILPKLKKLNI